jgi:hypothetical protein
MGTKQQYLRKVLTLLMVLLMGIAGIRRNPPQLVDHHQGDVVVVVDQNDTKTLILTRMGLYGEPFADFSRYPVTYQFHGNNDSTRLFGAFGSDHLNQTSCTAPGKSTIAIRAAYHGLGMNLLQLANFIMYAAISKHRDYMIAWIRTYEYDTEKNSYLSHPFQNWIEQHFTAFMHPSTTCPNYYKSVCKLFEGRCYGGMWENPSTNPKDDLW